MSRRTDERQRATIVSFSGMDGAGKSTQIKALCRHLRELGLRVCVLAFWDDVAMLARIRELSSHKLFKSEKGVGSPEKPVNRRDKNVQSWYLTASRLLIYLLDAISLRLRASRAGRGADILVFDRYLYDEMANLPLEKRWAQTYLRLLTRLAPQPDVAFLLDAEPLQARARKPEYPLEFLYRNRESYFTLSRILGNMTPVKPMPPAEVESVILRTALSLLEKPAQPRYEAIATESSPSR